MMESRVGYAGPLSGDQANLGKEILNGCTLAVESTNQAGGLRGRKIELVSMDDHNIPDKAKEAAYALCRKRPLFVVGHVDSGCSLEAAKIYHDHRILMITPTSTNPKLTEGGAGNVFRVCGRDDHQGNAAAIYLIKHYPSKTVGVIHDNSEYGRGLVQEFIKNYEFLSGVNVLFKEEVARGDAKMEQAAQKCVAAKPDVIYFGGLSKQGGAFLKALREQGDSSFFMSGDGCFEQDFIDTAGAAAEGALITFYPDLRPLAGTGSEAFIKQYQKRFGAEPGPYAAFGYEAVMLGLNAASNAASPLSDRTIADALRRSSFKTLFGILQFDDKGDLKESPYVMWTVENGKYKEVGI
jgi:branched-chain amino acid transport system substrate-binding protein